MPSARMDKIGTIRTGISALDPYLHGYIGMQIATPLYINIRQSAETSNILEDADRLYPGVDFKLRLTEESAYTPEIALGVQAALGHRRQSGEFIAASKRYNNFDFTAGLGWGRYGTAGHIDNPFTLFGTHFDDARDLNGESPNTPADWFTGYKIGLFGGVEYFLPVKGLSIKLDYGADRYTAEQESLNFKTPSPWGLGLSYAPTKWFNAGLGIQGTDAFMGRMTLKANPEKWAYNKIHYRENAKTNVTDDFAMPLRALPNKAPPDDLGVDQIYIQGATLFTTLHIPKNIPAPQHIRRVLDYIEIEYEDQIKNVKEYAFTLKEMQLEGTKIRFLRSDYTKALETKDSSPQEIWKNTKTSANTIKIEPNAIFLPTQGISGRTLFHTTLENQISLSEEDTGALYRSSVLFGTRDIPFFDTINAATLRLNLSNNLENLEDLRTRTLNPVRGDARDFANSRLSLEHSYIGLTQSLTPELHALFLSGYLDEFYAGLGGELLYRPHTSRFAIGAEFWHTDKRIPDSLFNLGTTGNLVNSAFANIWYDIPRHDVTANLRAGRFLAGDTGIEAGLEKRFKNGARLNAILALSNAADPDIFGDRLHAYHSINVTLPWGSIPFLNSSASLKTKIEPFARNAAQRIKKPVNLYDLTEKFTLDHIAENWDKISEEE